MHASYHLIHPVLANSIRTKGAELIIYANPQKQLGKYFQVIAVSLNKTL